MLLKRPPFPHHLLRAQDVLRALSLLLFLLHPASNLTHNEITPFEHFSKGNKQLAIISLIINLHFNGHFTGLHLLMMII